jgi:hypothetical protein
MFRILDVGAAEGCVMLLTWGWPIRSPWGMVPPTPPPSRPRRDSVVAGLLDLKFERQVTPILVRWVYLCALVVVAFGTLFGLLWVWSFATWLGAAIWLAAPVVVALGLVVLLSVRIVCERVIVSYWRALPRPHPPATPPGPHPPGPERSSATW